MNSPLLVKLIDRELKRQKAPPVNVLTECFPEQLVFIKDPAKRKKLCLTRRSGKSTTVGLYLINEALNNPRTSYVYVGLTKESAKNVMWMEIFESIILKLKVPAKLVGLKIKFTNGSIIHLTGADATYKEKEKLRGQKNKIAVIDECQSFTQDLKALVESIILPTLSDSEGTLCMIGTPGNEQGLHYWWQINDPKNQNTGWKDFHWTWKDNPFARDKVKLSIDEIVSKDPNIVKTTSFRQEWLGEWVIEDNARVYKSDKSINYITELPPNLLNQSTIYLLSIDLGYIDATAFVISCYNPTLNDKMYVLKSNKFQKLTISAVAEKIKEYNLIYNFRTMVVDAANLQAVEEMRLIHALPLWGAEKQGKEAHIALLNSDFQTARVLILKDTNQDLINELETLTWAQRDLLLGKHKEDPRKENHLCFIAGTKIETIYGPKNIEDIKVGDLILTRKGYLPAIWSGETGIEEIYYLRTKQNRELFATKTHPIFIENKLIPLMDLRCGNILTCIQEHLWLKKINTDQVLKSSIKELFTEDILSQKIGQKEYIFRPEEIFFTEQSGEILMEKFLKDIVFITLMKILSTIKLKICNFLHWQNTKNYIHLKDGKIQNIVKNSWKILIKLENQLKFGMLQKKEWSGINNMVKNLLLDANLLIFNVKSAKILFNLNFLMQKFVPKNVMQNKEEIQELMMKQEDAQLVQMNSNVINILNKNIVQDYVSIVKTTNQKAKVYNLTVQNQHEYFANGILVSNTDALLYGHHDSRHFWYEAKPVINPNSEDQIRRNLIEQHAKMLTQKNYGFEIDETDPNYDIKYMEQFAN